MNRYSDNNDTRPKFGQFKSRRFLGMASEFHQENVHIFISGPYTFADRTLWLTVHYIQLFWPSMNNPNWPKTVPEQWYFTIKIHLSRIIGYSNKRINCPFFVTYLLIWWSLLFFVTNTKSHFSLLNITNCVFCPKMDWFWVFVALHLKSCLEFVHSNIIDRFLVELIY